MGKLLKLGDHEIRRTTNLRGQWRYFGPHKHGWDGSCNGHGFKSMESLRRAWVWWCRDGIEQAKQAQERAGHKALDSELDSILN